MNDKNKKLDFQNFENPRHFFYEIHDLLFVFALRCTKRYPLLVCLFVCKRSLNVETTESIGPTFFVGSNMNPGKFYGW